MKMNSRELQIKKRHLPHWTLEGATYFVTFRVAEGKLATDEQQVVFDHILDGDRRFYALIACTVMPDHVHMILRPMGGFTLSQIMKGTKGVSAHKINRLTAVRKGTIWQRESFDRILRDQDELIEKANYMLNNSVKRGLVDDPWTYPFWYFWSGEESARGLSHRNV